MGVHGEEVRLLTENLVVEETQIYLGHEFYPGSLAGHRVVITTSGAGKTRAAARTQFLIDHFDITRLIFIGAAGALNPQLKLGDIVISQKAMEHDFDRSAGFGLERRGAHWYEADSQLVELALRAGERLGLGERLYLGKVLTGDQVIVQQSHKQELWQTFGGDCVEMVGAPAAMVCWANNIPWVLIRAICDYADESFFEDLLKWYQPAIQRSTSVILEMMKALPSEDVL
jgi:adenosylhomocysteine nucleosidase